MQIHSTSTGGGELPVTLVFPVDGAPYAVITIGGTDIINETTDDADQGIIAHAEAKRLLTEGTVPHRHAPAPGHHCCEVCGLLDGANPVHLPTGENPYPDTDAMPDEPVRYWPSLYGRALATDWTEGSLT